MWNLIKNKDLIEKIYKDSLPRLNNLTLLTIEIDADKVFDLKLIFELYELPHEMPEKWGKYNYNAVGVELLFKEFYFLTFDVRGNNFERGTLNAIERNNTYIVTYTDEFGNIVFSFTSKEIIFLSISSYVVDPNALD